MNAVEYFRSIGSDVAIAMAEGIERREACGRRGRHVGRGGVGQTEVSHCMGQSKDSVYRCDGVGGVGGCHKVYLARASS